MEKVIRVGKMPGRIVEVVVGEEATIQEVLSLAGLDASGFDIKVDGKLAKLDEKVGEANLVILAQRVKGNASI